MTTVDRVTIHHEGANAPHDDPGGAANGGYSIWIGVSKITVLRAPDVSWATFGYNHVSLDVCLSGNRMTFPVTNTDLDLLREAYTYARSQNWITDNPGVYPHGTIYPPPAGYPSGSSPTQCPGTLTIARWATVFSQFRVGGSVPVPKEEPMLFASNTQPNPSRFRGMAVDINARSIQGYGNAGLSPSPNLVPRDVQWLGAYSTSNDVNGKARFVIVTAADGGSEYEYTID